MILEYLPENLGIYFVEIYILRSQIPSLYSGMTTSISFFCVPCKYVINFNKMCLNSFSWFFFLSICVELWMEG